MKKYFFRKIQLLAVISLFCISDQTYSAQLPLHEKVETYTNLFMALLRGETKGEQYLQEVENSGLLADNTSIARVFKPILLASEQYQISLGVEDIDIPSNGDWKSLLEVNAVAYAITKSAYQQMYDENPIQSNRQLKAEMLVHGNKEAVAQVSYILGKLLASYGGYISAQVEFLYSLPEMQSINGENSLSTFTKEDTLSQIAYYFYMMGTFQEGSRYALQLAPTFEVYMEDGNGEFIFMQLPLLLSMAGEHENAFHFISMYEQITKQTQFQHLRYQYLFTAAVALILRNKTDDLLNAKNLLNEMINDSSSTKIKSFLSSIATMFIAAINGDRHEVENSESQLKKISKSTYKHYLTAERDTASAIAIAYEILGDETMASYAKKESKSFDSDIFRSSIGSSLTSISQVMQKEMDNLLLSNFKLQVEQQRLELITKKRNYLISGLIILFMFFVILWMWSRQKLSKRLADIDPLTGALNRRAMFRWLDSYGNTGSSHCVCLIDLDNFKHINDNYGHSTGDEVLETFSRLLLTRIRKTDRMCRYGGEEFLLVLHDMNLKNANSLISDIRAQLESITSWQSTRSKFSASFSAGLVELSKPAEYTSIIEKCDELLYESKDNGRAKTTTASWTLA